MTIHFKTQLLAATAVLAATATGAQAQVAFPAAELHGMGASSIAVLLPTELNCLSGSNKYGKNDGTESSVTEGNYTGADGALNCATTDVQPNISGKYISTGSGTGRLSYKNINNALTGAAGLIFPTAASWGTAWTNVHFAMTDSPLLAAELTAFNTASAAKGADVAATADKAAYRTKGAGAAIQFPLYVLPVAIAYNPVYGHKVTENVDLKFNVATPVAVGTTATGGLRLTKSAYCGIFNGYITNWNNAKITASNTYLDGKKVLTKSLMDTADSATRWNADGVPIRLVGRLDKSGTTDIFTRHLAAVCSGVSMSGPNKYSNAAETLPYSTSSAIDMTSIKSDSNIKPSVSSSSLAGTADMISGAYYASGAIVTTKGAEAAGKYIVANGSGDVAAAINLAADKASASDANVLLNGKVGYIAADYVAPAVGRTLLAAALEQGNSAATSKPVFLMPTAANATTAFGTKILPPQSDKSGKYVSTAAFDRANPLDWYEALYAGGATLANPVTGYAITGTTQFLTGTCFADKAIRNGMATFLNATLGNLKLNSANAKLSPNAFIGTATGKAGFKAQLGIAPMPTAWSTAITETFLKYSTQKSADGTTLLGARGLYIQNGLPLKAADLPLKTAVTSLVKGKTVQNQAGPNPNCTDGQGL